MRERARNERVAERPRGLATPEIACINIGHRHFHSVNFPRWTHPRDRDEILYASHVSRRRCTHRSATRCGTHDLVREFKKNIVREREREKITASRKMANSPIRITRIAVKRVIGTNGLRMTMIRWLYNVLAVVVPLVEGYNCLSR